MGIFSKRANKEGAIAGMSVGLVFTFTYIAYFKFVAPELNNTEYWLWGISPEGIGTIGMLLNFAIAIGVSRLTAKPPQSVQELVDNIRIPSSAKAAAKH